MEHDRAERLISERLDGVHLPARAAAALEEHLAACAGCRAFERAAWRLREAARFEIAPAVPDLVDPIMVAIGADAERAATRRARPALRVVRPTREQRRSPRPHPRAGSSGLAPAVAALLVGALVGSILVGGPWRDRSPAGDGAIAAEDVSRGVAGAATSLEAYRARFAVTEYHHAPGVPVRELSMQVWFRAPERFRLDVFDRTGYPEPTTPTNLRLIVDGDAWYSSGPAPCPSARCPQRELSVRNRTPFSSAAPAPTDLVLPLTALARPEAMTVLGRGTVLGRPAVRVEVTFERAASLFPFLAIGGEWRPFFPNDHVRIWLDEERWFPLRWEVYPAGGRERDAWALRFGLPEEPARRPIFRVEALSVDLATPPEEVFRIPRTGDALDQGGRVVALETLGERVGFEAIAPRTLGGLDLYRVVVPEGGGEALLTYADGLSFVKVGQTGSWTGDGPFGPVDVRSEEVALGDGVAYYEPATLSHGRRLSIHASGIDLYVESNLPRERLLSIAAGLPVTGMSLPERWRIRAAGGATVERVSLEEASAAVPFPIPLPTALPAGVTLASVEVVRIEGWTGVDVYLRDAEVDVGTGPIRLHVEPGAELPPATAARQATVTVGGVDGRWTPGRDRLEWVVGGVYRSLDAPGLGLEELLAVAASIPEAR
ncbi:MAG TPA: zf-HC2 domain-containing protein [Actinomycetota bacterium]